MISTCRDDLSRVAAESEARAQMHELGCQTAITISLPRIVPVPVMIASA